MEETQKFFVVIYFFSYLLIFTNGNEWISFKRMEALDGKSCAGTDIAFSKTLIFDKSACLCQCVTHSGCESVFHGQFTGDCKGCTKSYSTTNIPSGLLDDSKYYGQLINCPSGWTSFDKSCYFISEKKMNFMDGQEECLSYNSRPVIIEDENENSFLEELIKSNLTDDDEFGFFTGFTDIITEGTWVEHGTSNQMTFQGWNPGEPNNLGDEDCSAFYIPLDLKWVDIPCGMSMRIICERDSI